MGFGNFLRGIAAQVNPFDNGKTYGSYNPKKKRDDQNNFGSGYSSAAPRQAPSQTQSITVQQPQNRFDTGITHINQLGVQNNTVNPLAPHNAVTTAYQQPGTVIKPTTPQPPAGTTVNGHFVPAAPKKQNFFQKAANVIKWGGQSAGEAAGGLGLATARMGTGLVQGATEIPSLAAHGVDAAKNAVTHQTGPSRATDFIDRATHVIDKPLNHVNVSLDTAARHLGKDNSAVVPAYHAQQVLENVGLMAPLLESISAKAPVVGKYVANANNALDGARGTKAVDRILHVASRGRFGALPKIPLADQNSEAEIMHALEALPEEGLGAAGVGAYTGDTVASAQYGESPLTGKSANRPAPYNAPSGDAVPTGTRIPIQQSGGTVPIPVSVPRQGGIIRELGGDAPTVRTLPTPEEVAASRARTAFEGQTPARPDGSVDGIVRVPRTQPYKINPEAANTAQGDIIDQYATMLKDVGEGNGTQLVPNGEGGYLRTSNNVRNAANKGKRMTKQDWRDQAEAELRAGRGEPGHQQAFNEATNPEVQSLLAKGDTTAEPPMGRPIQVKKVTGIPVEDKSVVPANMPETPGQVRATEQSSPMAAKSEAVANAPVVATPAPLPKEVQAVLDNPKQFNKRQVKAAKNQAKLAKEKAKADEATAAATQRSLSAKPTSDKGFVQTGEYTKGRNGNVTQVTHRSSEAAQGAHDTANLSVDDVVTAARDEINSNGVVSPETTRNLKALRDSGTLDRTSPEFKAVNNEYKNAISHHARALSMTDRTARTTSTGDQLANRFVSKIVTFAEDSGKLTDAHIKQVTDAENAFTDARDAATAAGEQFKATGSEGDFQAWKAAHQAAEKADRQARITEYTVSKDVLKGNKSIEASKAVQDAEKNAGVYSMDSIDSNMLSGTGTMVRNFVNTLFPRIENKAFGYLSTRAVKPIATVGGSSSRGGKIGATIGKDMYKADIAARKDAGVGIIRRTVTAGNTIGERNIQATAHAKAFDHYKQLLRKDGYTGKELDNRVEYNVRTDPDGLVAQYEKDALQANALSSLTHTKKIENVLADTVQKALAGAGFGGKGQQAGRFGAKAVTRVGLGFPTVIAKSLAEGLKRVTLGIPEAGWSTAKFLNTGNKEAYAGELAKAMQHAGSGGAMILLGRELGKMGVVSGAYPSDQAERDKWQAEGRQENSINIGGQWFNIPGYLGGFALPLMLGATTAAGNIKDEASFKNAWSTVLAASPVDNIQSTLDIITGNGSDAKIKNAATSLARAATPAGAFLAELAKMTDSTQNDTSTKGALRNILDNIAGGIPGLNNKVNTIAKTDSFGNELHNPNPAAIALGAQGVEQKQGQQDVQAAQNGANDSLTQLKDAGVIGDKNLMQLVDAKLAKKINSNQPLTPDEISQVQKAVTKGVSATDDNNWRENGQYETDKAALSAKLQMLEADPTAKNSDKAMIKTQITRDDLLSQYHVPYDDLKLYQDTGLDDWRKMGDPESDTYDADTYQKLWDIDNLFTKAGVSYKKGELTTNKFSAKKPGKGRGHGRGRGSGSGSGSYSSDFGTLKAGRGAPEVQQYQSIDQSSGGVPVIQVQRPNIVHKIGFSG